MKPAFLSKEYIKHSAAEVIAAYERQTGTRVEAPVPIEQIIEITLDINILWDAIPSANGRPIAAKFVQPARTSPARIVLNEDLMESVFEVNPGFEHTTLGHETGHAVLHQESHRRQQLSLDLRLEEPALELLTRADHMKDGLQQAIALRGPDNDDAWREWQAFSFMRHILMPHHILSPMLSEGGYLSWSGNGGLYDLRDQLGVTISALVTHLKILRLIDVTESKQIINRAAIATGQQHLTQ